MVTAAMKLSIFPRMDYRGLGTPPCPAEGVLPASGDLPGESQGWGSLVGCCLWGHTELDTTEVCHQPVLFVFFVSVFWVWIEH